MNMYTVVHEQTRREWIFAAYCDNDARRYARVYAIEKAAPLTIYLGTSPETRQRIGVAVGREQVTGAGH
jgi:hypothetical protein